MGNLCAGFSGVFQEISKSESYLNEVCPDNIPVVKPDAYGVTTWYNPDKHIFPKISVIFFIRGIASSGKIGNWECLFPGNLIGCCVKRAENRKCKREEVLGGSYLFPTTTGIFQISTGTRLLQHRIKDFFSSEKLSFHRTKRNIQLRRNLFVT